jgi:hypothetical protein
MRESRMCSAITIVVPIHGLALFDVAGVSIVHFVLRILVTLALVAVVGKSVRGEDGLGATLAIIEHPPNVAKLKTAYTDLLKSASPQRLRVLAKQGNDGLALSAAWREAIRSWETETPMHPSGRCAFERFVGFVDGRLFVEIPEWWEHNVASAVWHSAGNTSFRLERAPMVEASTSAGTVYVANGWSVMKSNDGFELTTRDTRVVVPSGVLERMNISAFAPIFSPVVDGESVFILIAENIPYHGAELVKLSRTTGKVLWERKVWTGGELTEISIGPAKTAHVIEPRVGRDGKIYAFGTSSLGAYIASFAASDGMPQMRFSTLYLQEW